MTTAESGPPEPWMLNGAGHYEAPRGRDYPPHVHHTWEFTYYLRGSIPCPIGSAVPWGHPGAVLFTPPGVLHSERAVTGYANYFLGVDVAGGPAPPSVLHDDEHGTVRQLFSMIVREWQTHRTESPDVLVLLMRVLREVVRRSGPGIPLSPAERVVREAEHVIESRLPDPIRMHEVAREVGVSPSALRLHFTRRRGITPIQYLHQVRLRHALARIQESDASLERVAELCGYNSSSHLSRQVKRLTGRTPGSFRRPDATGSA